MKLLLPEPHLPRQPRGCSGSDFSRAVSGLCETQWSPDLEPRLVPEKPQKQSSNTSSLLPEVGFWTNWVPSLSHLLLSLERSKGITWIVCQGSPTPHHSTPFLGWMRMSLHCGAALCTVRCLVVSTLKPYSQPPRRARSSLSLPGSASPSSAKCPLACSHFWGEKSPQQQDETHTGCHWWVCSHCTQVFWKAHFMYLSLGKLRRLTFKSTYLGVKNFLPLGPSQLH